VRSERGINNDDDDDDDNNNNNNNNNNTGLAEISLETLVRNILYYEFPLLKFRAATVSIT
jgi:hypothetical protein